MFVDTSGRRARLLRRAGVLAGVACLGYAIVLGMAFMGWGTSLSPAELLPFDGGAAPGGAQGGAPTGRPPSGAPPAGAGPSPSVSASASASVSASPN